MNFGLWIIIGFIIGAIIEIVKAKSLRSRCSSKEEYEEIQKKQIEARRKKRKAYWDGPMNRRDWFWWGRW